MPHKDPAARRAYRNEYRAANQDKFNAYARAGRARNLDEARRKDKLRTEADRELFRARNRASYEARDQRFKLLAGARGRARNKGIEFSITVEDIIIPAVCPVLGIEISPGKGARGAHWDGSPSLDRLDPKKGYVRGNVEVISNRANVIKNSGTAEEHEAIAKFIRARLDT